MQGLLSLLASLSPELHEQVDQSVTRKREQNTDRCIPPAVVVVIEVDSGQVVATTAVLADPTVSRRIAIDKVVASTRASEPSLEVLGAGLARWRVEDGELRLLAVDLPVEIHEDEECTHEVVEGIEVVEPVAPERLDLGVWDENTAEGDKDTDDEGIDEGGEDGVRRVGSDELTKASVEEPECGLATIEQLRSTDDLLVHKHDEEHRACFVGWHRKTGGVVEAKEVKDAADDEVGHLRDDETGGEGSPVIHLGLLLSGLVDITTVDEQRLELRDDTRGDEDIVEKGEEDQLLLLDGVANLPEGESDKESDANVEGKLVVDVVNVAIQADVHALSDEPGLSPHVGSELMSVVSGSRRLARSVVDDVFEVLLHLGLLGRVKPDLVPIPFTCMSAGNNINHELCGVDTLRTGYTFSVEVVFDSLAVVTDITEVNGLTSFSKQQEGVELSKELGRRLMDGDQDCLTHIGKLSEEADSVEGSLSVKTGGRLVQEDQNGRL